MKKPLPKEDVLLLQRKGEKRREQHLRNRKKPDALKLNNKKQHDNSYRIGEDIHLPEVFDLDHNYKKVINIINCLRGNLEKNEISYINFNAIRHINTAAALMLAAELEINKIRFNVRKMKAHDSKWDAKIRVLLTQMGFLQLLDAPSEVSLSSGMDNDEVFVEFTSSEVGIGLAGEPIIEIIRKVEESVKIGKIPPELQLPLFAGISEAITNSHHHAYEQANKLNRWWVSASVNRQTKEIKVICYDRGDTIPTTIRKSEKKMRLIEAIFGDPDYKIIGAAMEKKRTSTKKENRGKGLSQLMEFIGKNRQGYLKIYSGSGILTYSLEHKESEIHTFSEKLSPKMCGTLIEWNIILNKAMG